MVDGDVQLGPADYQLLIRMGDVGKDGIAVAGFSEAERASRTRLWQAGYAELRGDRWHLTYMGENAALKALVDSVMAGSAPPKAVA